MPRRNNQDPQTIFEQTNRILKEHLNLPTIKPVIQRLIENTEYLHQVISSNWNLKITLNSRIIFDKIGTITNLLTKKETQRYFFDSALLGAIKQDLSASPSTASFSAHMYPSYLMDVWGHKIYPFPVKSTESSFDDYISFIFFPGTDILEKIELDDYAFILHEMGHELQHHHKDLFNDGFKSDLEKVLHQETLAGLADKGALKSKTQKLTDELRLKWSPTDNHENWSSEMMNDLIALWSLGPAYLYNFENHLRHDSKQNPYELVQSHPPLALRVEAMIDAGQQLNWRSETEGLRELLKEWRSSSWGKTANNQYYALRHEKILRSCIDNTLRTCRKLQLPPCDRNRIDVIQRELEDCELPNIGIDIVIAAWIVKHQKSENDFLEWEKQTVSQINDLIFQQYGILQQES